MTRWLLALLFAFGTVTFMTGCEEDTAVEDAAEDIEDGAEDIADDIEDGAEDITE